MAKQYQHLFFDLDHTLWDFEANSRLTLEELFVHHDLENQLKTSSTDFYTTYIAINDRLWSQYRKGEVTKEILREKRFFDTFDQFGLSDAEFSKHFEDEYLEKCPHKTQLLPGTEELLEHLRGKYELHVITNGFVETQKIKMTKSGLHQFFGRMFSSEEIGVNKPDSKIFIESMRQTGAEVESSLMVGDNLEADIVGAKNCGMDQVFYNPGRAKHQEAPTFEVSHLLQLKEFL